MHDYIQIATINDFLFCPRSIYLHSVYAQFCDDVYKSRDQKQGTFRHAASDAARYSTHARYWQGREVVSHTYRMIGSIDIFDRESGVLIERKTSIRRIYDGYRYQLYAQKLCLEEMGERVNAMQLHDLTTNARYGVTLTKYDHADIGDILRQMRSTTPETLELQQNTNKCKRCIYRELCRPLPQS